MIICEIKKTHIKFTYLLNVVPVVLYFSPSGKGQLSRSYRRHSVHAAYVLFDCKWQKSAAQVWSEWLRRLQWPIAQPSPSQNAIRLLRFSSDRPCGKQKCPRNLGRLFLMIFSTDVVDVCNNWTSINLMRRVIWKRPSLWNGYFCENAYTDISYLFYDLWTKVPIHYNPQADY